MIDKGSLAALAAGALCAVGAYKFQVTRESFRQDMERYHDAMIDDGSTVSEIRKDANGDSVNLQYKLKKGGKDAPVAVVLHASGGGWDQADLMATEILPDDCTVLSISRAGYLKSTPVESTLEQCQDLQLLLKMLGIDKIAVLFGMSIGAAMAFQFATLFPDKIGSIVALSPFVPYDGDDASKPQKPKFIAPPGWILKTFFGSDFVKWASLQAGLGDSMCGVTKDTTPKGRRVVSAFLDTLFPVSARFPGFLIDVYQWMPLRLTADQLQSLKCPILIIAASDDAQCKPSENSLPAAMEHQTTQLVRPTGGHMLVADIENTRRNVVEFVHKAKN